MWLYVVLAILLIWAGIYLYNLSQLGKLQIKAELVEQLWESLIREYLLLGSESKWIVAENSGHFIHMSAPDLLTRTVRELVFMGE